MVAGVAYEVSVLFAALVGAAGLPVSVLAWRQFRGAPFGRVLAVLPVFMLLFAVYHSLLLVFPSMVDAALLLEGAAFGLLVVFGALAVRLHYRMSRRGRELE